MENWIILSLVFGWLLIGLLLVLARLRYDSHFGGWAMMMSHPGNGTVKWLVVILVVLWIFPPLQLVIK
jgi:hypothetical protein